MEELQNIFGFYESEEDKKYTTKVDIPQYLPSGDCPHLEDCVDTTKYYELIKNIDNSNVSENEKKFLKLCATRHIVFTYSKIADYYAHASKEMQELMEQSALVIIDFNDAIANGYIKYSKAVEELMKNTGKYAKDEYKNQARDTRK